MQLNGKQQRNALTAAERSLQALGRGDAARARRSAQKAADLDQLGLFAKLPGAVTAAGSDIDSTGEITTESWDALSTAVGPGPLQFLITELRDSAG